jgi:hypothetical protein
MPSVKPCLLLAVASLCLGGCFLTTEPTSNPLSGCWYEDIGIPGSGFEFTLQEHDSLVTGSGTWSGEALGGGTANISGHRSGNDFTLEIEYIASFGYGSRTAELKGAAKSRVRLEGVYTYPGGSSSQKSIFRRCP